jgi:excisionase family DNA binding protein
LQLGEGKKVKANDPLLSIEEAAKRLGGISRHTVIAWLVNGRLRRTKVGRRTMIRESELKRVIKDERSNRVADGD